MNDQLSRWIGFKCGCDPYGVVRGGVVDGTRGLRPRAMGWVCSAYLGFAATPTGSGGDFSLILTRGLRPLAMLWHPYGMLENGMLRIRLSFLNNLWESA